MKPVGLIDRDGARAMKPGTDSFVFEKFSLMLGGGVANLGFAFLNGSTSSSWYISNPLSPS